MQRTALSIVSTLSLGVAAAFAFGACSSKSNAPAAAADAGSPEASTACEPVLPSAGDDPCTAPLAAGTDRKCVFDFNGTQREFLIYAPKSFDSCKPAAVVIDAHGATETDEQHAGLAPFRTWPGGLGSGWRLVADREGFVVVTPQGIGNAWGEKDADFILEVQKMTTQVARVDPKRVYLTGISNGAFLNYWTACRDTDVFRGFAPISGDVDRKCPTTHPAPMIAFHAKGDSIVPYSGGHDGAVMWAAANHCKSGPTPSLTFGGPQADDRALCLASTGDTSAPWKLAACDKSAPPTTCETWDHCDEGVKVVFCTVSSDKQPVGGHILYFNDTGLSLAAVSWEFFKGN